MSDSDPKPSSARPSRVTLAASMGAASCLVLIFTLFDTLARLRGVEMRSGVEDQLAQPPFDTLDVTADQVLGVMRAVAFVDGALAAAGLVLAVFLFRRHRGARYAFTVVAALLLLSAPVAGLLSFLAAASAVMLWSEESRAWFAGREPRRSTSRTQESSKGSGGWPFAPGHRHGAADRGDGSAGTGAVPGAPAPDAPRTPDAGTPQPPPYAGSFGETGGAEQTAALAEQPGGPSGPDVQASYHPPAQAADSRPGTVTAAVVLTFVGSVLGIGLGLMLVLGLAAQPDTIRDAVRQDSNFESIGWDVERVIALLWVCAAVLVGWSVVGVLLGVFALRRQTWARWTLLLSAAMTAMLSLLAILSLVSAIPMIMGAVTVGLLLSRSAGDWFSGGSGSSGGSGHQAPPSPPQWSERPGPW